MDLLYTGCYSNDVGVSKIPNDFLLQRLNAKLSVWKEEKKIDILWTYEWTHESFPPIPRVKRSKVCKLKMHISTLV